MHKLSPTTLLKNQRFLFDRQEEFPRQIKTCKGATEPRPENVSVADCGFFVRVPFTSHVVWGFTCKKYLEAFKRLYPECLREGEVGTRVKVGAKFTGDLDKWRRAEITISWISLDVTSIGYHIKGSMCSAPGSSSVDEVFRMIESGEWE